jgi:hypothetical protein
MMPKITRFGIEWDHKGDWVVWLWPWKRISGLPILSIGFEAGFYSLYDLDLTWWDYDMHELSRVMQIQRQGHPWFFYGGFKVEGLDEKIDSP